MRDHIKLCAIHFKSIMAWRQVTARERQQLFPVLSQTDSLATAEVELT